MARCLLCHPYALRVENDGVGEDEMLLRKDKYKMVAVVGYMMLALSCSAKDEADRLTDCQQICDKYASCYDKSYDVSACRSHCDDSAKNDKDFDNKVDNCENCLDGKSCTDATFSCATECVGIVP